VTRTLLLFWDAGGFFMLHRLRCGRQHADIFELVSELAPLHPRDNTFPGEVFIRVAEDALDWVRGQPG